MAFVVSFEHFMTFRRTVRRDRIPLLGACVSVRVRLYLGTMPADGHRMPASGVVCCSRLVMDVLWPRAGWPGRQGLSSGRGRAVPCRAALRPARAGGTSGTALSDGRPAFDEVWIVVSGAILIAKLHTSFAGRDPAPATRNPSATGPMSLFMVGFVYCQ